MRFGITILLLFVFEIGLMSPYEIVDYRIPLWHPLLASVAVENRDAELSYYLEKLNVDYPKDNVEPIMKSYLYVIWNDDFQFMKSPVENPHACELSKTRVNSTTFEYHDTITDFGITACYNQCVTENEEFYRWFLTSKMQRLVWNNQLVDFVLEVPQNFSGDLKIFECSRLAAKKYRCDCFYRNYRIKVSHDFGRLFDKILLEVRGMTRNTTREELDNKYGISMKLIAFLIICHLSPEHMFTFIVWWADTEPESGE